MASASEKQLFEIASAQQGYFTSGQAIKAGYQTNNHSYHVRRGNWIREHRGIYRLSNYPEQPEGQYVLWSLWSFNRKGIAQGVFSHETALSIYDVSDVMPAKIHMSVPKSFRRNSEIPKILMLHQNDLSEKDVQLMTGYKVTSPARTILDLARTGQLQDNMMGQAVREFQRRGLLTQSEIINIIKKDPETAKFFFPPMQKESRT